MNRNEAIEKLKTTELFDFVVIGGGATGASVALDAAARGFKVALLEQHDFGKGTSSRSTKLVHGGVRYLAQGNITLVRDALHERTRLRENAPHVVHEMSFIVPCANRFDQAWFRFGFWLYDWLSGKSGFRKARSISQSDCLQRIPTLEPAKAVGGVLYSDGQFDDSRLLLSMLQSAADHGAVVVNYMRVEQLVKNAAGKIVAVEARDLDSGLAHTSKAHSIKTKCVINATGPFCDAVRKLDVADGDEMVSASQGVHIVLDPSFLPGETAVIVPKTSDGRVIFMIPWLDHVLVGTTDTPIDRAELEPRARPEEIEFLLTTAGEYLTKKPRREDILSVFTGIRPLVGKGKSIKTSKLSRDHVIEISDAGLVTITGGKWTTARRMGQDCVDRAIASAGLERRPCTTFNLPLHGSEGVSTTQSLSSVGVYGASAKWIDQLAAEDFQLAKPLVEGYSLRGAEVLWAVRHEMARTVEDVLARRSRLLFLNVVAAETAAPEVARLMARELGRDEHWIQEQLTSFGAVAHCFRS